MNPLRWLFLGCTRTRSIRSFGFTLLSRFIRLCSHGAGFAPWPPEPMKVFVSLDPAGLLAQHGGMAIENIARCVLTPQNEPQQTEPCKLWIRGIVPRLWRVRRGISTAGQPVRPVTGTVTARRSPDGGERPLHPRERRLPAPPGRTGDSGPAVSMADQIDDCPGRTIVQQQLGDPAPDARGRRNAAHCLGGRLCAVQADDHGIHGWRANSNEPCGETFAAVRMTGHTPGQFANATRKHHAAPRRER